MTCDSATTSCSATKQPLRTTSSLGCCALEGSGGELQLSALPKTQQFTSAPFAPFQVTARCNTAQGWQSKLATGNSRHQHAHLSYLFSGASTARRRTRSGLLMKWRPNTTASASPDATAAMAVSRLKPPGSGREGKTKRQRNAAGHISRYWRGCLLAAHQNESRTDMSASPECGDIVRCTAFSYQHR